MLSTASFTGEIHHSRETGLPEQPQGEIRRTLAQNRPSAAPPTFTSPSQTQVLSFFAAQTTRAPTRSRFSLDVRLLYPRRCSLRGVSGPRQPPKKSQERYPLRLCRQKISASDCGAPGRTRPPLASLVALSLVFVDPSALFAIFSKHFCSIGPKGVCSRSSILFKSNQFHFFMFDYHDKGFSLRRALIAPNC